MKECYGATQVKELYLTKSDILDIVKENVYNRMDQSYDFDYKNPIVLWDKDNVILRYVQKTVTHDVEPRYTKMKPFPKNP